MGLNNRLLLVGGGYADIPLILAAKKLGYFVITTGNRPEDLGHVYADEYYCVDYSDCKKVYKLAQSLNVSAICPCCNDFSALSAAYAAEKLGLPGHDSFKTAEIIHHKDRFRQFAIANNIPSPRAIGFSSQQEALDSIEKLSFPVIVKPVDLTGGKGISVVNSIEEACPAVQKAFAISKAHRIVVEEYIYGTRHGFSAFLYKGKVNFYFTDNEYYFLNPYMVSAASAPGNVAPSVKANLCWQAEKIASLLGLKDGIFHIQFILREDQPVIIEICRRAPGDMYIKLVEYVAGVDYPSWIVKAFAGLDCGGLMPSTTRRFITRHCIMSS
ncbi:ATP-grasp domain-containing protein [Syntrophomonas palmitatica]|uniref:ATP-grasp domain-containing protein n=1 Tax=Syntrophomonas palmitatica TaxID=402877 RepID=UPI0006D1E17A|nr:ATP-grasp domain-containing protein [Syntrophomonas palmitatica]